MVTVLRLFLVVFRRFWVGCSVCPNQGEAVSRFKARGARISSGRCRAMDARRRGTRLFLLLLLPARRCPVETRHRDRTNNVVGRGNEDVASCREAVLQRNPGEGGPLRRVQMEEAPRGGDGEEPTPVKGGPRSGGWEVGARARVSSYMGWARVEGLVESL